MALAAEEGIAFRELSGDEIWALFWEMGWTCPPCARVGTAKPGEAVVGNLMLKLGPNNPLVDQRGKVHVRQPETRINVTGMIYPDIPLSAPRLELGGPSSESRPAHSSRYVPFLHFCLMRVAFVGSSLWCEVRFREDGRRPLTMHGFENEHHAGDYRVLLRVTRAWTNLMVTDSGGRKPILTREEILTKWQEYADWCDANAERPIRVGFAAHIGVDRDTLRAAMNREGLPFPPA